MWLVGWLMEVVLIQEEQEKKRAEKEKRRAGQSKDKKTLIRTIRASTLPGADLQCMIPKLTLGTQVVYTSSTSRLQVACSLSTGCLPVVDRLSTAHLLRRQQPSQPLPCCCGHVPYTTTWKEIAHTSTLLLVGHAILLARATQQAVSQLEIGPLDSAPPVDTQRADLP